MHYCVNINIYFIRISTPDSKKFCFSVSWGPIEGPPEAPPMTALW